MDGSIDVIRKFIVVLCILLLFASAIFEVYVQLEVKEQMADTIEIPFLYRMHIMAVAPLFWLCIGCLAATWLAKPGQYGRILLCMGLAIIIVYGIAWCTYQKISGIYVILYWIVQHPMFFVCPGAMIGIGIKTVLESDLPPAK